MTDDKQGLGHVAGLVRESETRLPLKVVEVGWLLHRVESVEVFRIILHEFVGGVGVEEL